MSDEKISISIEVDPDALSGYSNTYLMTLWHAVQANPAPHGDRLAGELAERVGREIIRRWLRTVEPDLWNHQGRDHFWTELRQLGTWHEGVFIPHERDRTVPDAEDDQDDEGAGTAGSGGGR